MSNMLSRLFKEHPSEVGEGYFEHMGHSATYGWRLLKASACAFAHALIPAVHKTTASQKVCEMAGELGGRAVAARDERCRRAGAYDPVI